MVNRIVLRVEVKKDRTIEANWGMTQHFYGEVFSKYCNNCQFVQIVGRPLLPFSTLFHCAVVRIVMDGGGYSGSDDSQRKLEIAKDMQLDIATKI